MIVSMTGFATRKGQSLGYAWAWDIRAVNGKGLDLRLRLPDWIEGLEIAVRAELQKALARGNLSLSLRLSRETEGNDTGLRLNAVALDGVLAAMRQIEARAATAGLQLHATSAAAVLGLRGVIETSSSEEDTAPLRQSLLADLMPLLNDFNAMRSGEGAALQRVIAGQLDEIARLTQAATEAAALRASTAAQTLREAVARLLATSEVMDESRLAQELALLAVKQDVTEELDRLRAHVEAARSLLDQAGPVGRKFDFLMQEFMREANTLCSKAQALDLTRIGLDLKTVIDQMREQVQNVE